MNRDSCTRVCLTSLVDTNNTLLNGLRQNCSSNSRGARLTLVDEPKDAQVVILADTGYFGWRHVCSAFRYCGDFKDKYVLAINNTDWPYPVFDGFYPSITRRCRGAFSWGYYLEQKPIQETRQYRQKYLYSFVGRACTHKVRQQLLELDGIKSPCIDIDNIPKRMDKFDYSATYNEILNESEFVLCPRGFGASSFRLFEVMRAGRVPIIISDKWIAPPLGDWNSFSIRVNESNVSDIPRLVHNNRCMAKERGNRAKECYERYFGSQVYLETIIRFYMLRAQLFSWKTLIARSVLRSRTREMRQVLRG
jgi:Exostosin family